MTQQLQLFESRRPRRPVAPPRVAPTGEMLRDRGIALGREHNAAWFDSALRLFVEEWLPAQTPGFEFIGETFRNAARAAGLPAPKHCNAWGALFARISRSGLVEDTGTTSKMTLPGSHARRSPVYRKPFLPVR